jgi:bifunctional DNA-binding transcriptional regulator/antitoxin component of YhaV-PrlF toxin-antitoxin module
LPQLVKGGKHVFGWSLVQKKGRIVIPEEAYIEYEFNTCDKIIVIPGSSTSGGFSIARVNQIAKGPFKEILTLLDYSEETKTFDLPELKLMKYKNKRYVCWVKLATTRYFTMLSDILSIYSIEIGDKLLVCRGSGHALGFISRGPIVEIARKHSELKTFR